MDESESGAEEAYELRLAAQRAADRVVDTLLDTLADLKAATHAYNIAERKRLEANRAPYRTAVLLNLDLLQQSLGGRKDAVAKQLAWLLRNPHIGRRANPEHRINDNPRPRAKKLSPWVTAKKSPGTGKRGQLLLRRDDPSYWLVRVFAGQFEGKRRYINRTLRGTKADAENALVDLLSEIAPARPAIDPAVKMTPFLRDYYLPAKEGTISARTFTGYRNIIEGNILPHLGQRSVSGLTPQAVTRFFDLAKSDSPSGRELSPASVKAIRAVLSDAMAYAVRQGIIRANPVRDADLPT